MRKNSYLQKAKELEAYYSQFPDWYWKYGLHDARITVVTPLELPTQWKEKKPRYNCLEIHLDASGAMFETNVTKIALYNYKLKENVDIAALEMSWWLRDTLTKQGDRYRLDLIIETAKGNKKQFAFTFDTAEVTRK